MSETRPNILFIMSDDHTAQAISAYQGNINHTPHIDRIAENGAILEHCYVTNSICTPSRAAILTGTYNHVNGVISLETPLDPTFPQVAKYLQAGGYQTAMIGKWHLGEGEKHWPTGFDFWSILPGQGDYFDPPMTENGKPIQPTGYTTEIITQKSADWLKNRNPEKPFFMMCHHKAPHRPWQYHPKYEELYKEEIPYPASFNDDYQNRAKAAKEARMKIESNMTYLDLDLVQPYEPAPNQEYSNRFRKTPLMMVPFPQTPQEYKNFKLICSRTGDTFTFKNADELKRFKHQRYMQKYLRTVASIDESVGELLDLLESEGIADNTIVIYTSDQGFFLGEHGWYDKRFIYEESFRMPFLIQYPARIKAGTKITSMASNVDFAPTWLEYAGLPIPSFMQGKSLKPVLEGNEPENWQKTAYHRYWMNQDTDHNAYAHYGIRDHRYKLIFWYNAPLDTPGAHSADFEEKDWELFDLQEDPRELHNCFYDTDKKDVVLHMLTLLDNKQAEIGDIPYHDSIALVSSLNKE